MSGGAQFSSSEMALRRCSRCECTYHNDDEPCRFHAGRFRGWWTCCKEPLQSAQGCRSGLHIEDAAATAMFDAYAPTIAESVPVPECLPVAMVVNTPTSSEAGEVATADSIAPAPPLVVGGAGGGDDAQSRLVPYVVGFHDTWNGLCMRHNMTGAELQRVKGLRRRTVKPGDVVLVWGERSDDEAREDVRRALVAQFRRRCQCSTGEALYYLTGAEYEIDAAIKTRQADLRWEQERQAEEAAKAAAAEEKRARRQIPTRMPPAADGSWVRCVQCVA